MEAALLIVLVGELTAPLKPHLEQALPAAFEERVALVAEAPPGRDVVWVTAPTRDDVVLTLHIAKEPGDLRRELKFSRSDPLPARGRAVAFAIASMRAGVSVSHPLSHGDVHGSVLVYGFGDSLKGYNIDKEKSAQVVGSIGFTATF